MKSLQAQFSFCQLLMLCTASAAAKTHCVIDQDMSFSNVNTSEKQAKYKQEEGKHSFQPSWQ